MGSVVGMHGLSCSSACGIFTDQGLNPCLPHWDWILHHWATREAWLLSLLKHFWFSSSLFFLKKKIRTGCLVELYYVLVVQRLSCVRLIVIPWTAAHQASLFFTVPQSLLRLMSIELMMPSNHLILYCPLFLLKKRLYPNQSI